MAMVIEKSCDTIDFLTDDPSAIYVTSQSTVLTLNKRGLEMVKSREAFKKVKGMNLLRPEVAEELVVTMRALNETVNDSIKDWKMESSVLKKDVEVLKNENMALKNDVEVLKVENAVLKQDVIKLKRNNVRLDATVSYVENFVDEYKKLDRGVLRRQ